MNSYDKSASTSRRFEFGINVITGLLAHPETAMHAAAFAKLNGAMKASGEVTTSWHVVILTSRARLRLALIAGDKAIRKYGNNVQIADGGTRGPLFAALLPNGIREATSARGASKSPAMVAITTRFELCQLSGADAVRTACLDDVRAARDQVVDAVAQRDAAEAAWLKAFAEEKALRDLHRVEVDKLMGHVRSAFPRDHRKQDTIFPKATRRRSTKSPAAPVAHSQHAE